MEKEETEEEEGGVRSEYVFAHLPICRSGLPFLVCADWDLVSSREQIHKEASWNLWLRDQVVDAFVEAIRSDSLIRDSLGDYMPHALTSATTPSTTTTTNNTATNNNSSATVLDGWWRSAWAAMIAQLRTLGKCLTRDSLVTYTLLP